MVKVLVAGSGGMLGRAVMAAGASVDGVEVIGYPHDALDITDAGHVYGVLRDDRPEVVINCAGLTKHRNPSEIDMRRVNSLGPLLLARTCEAVGARLIHVSTDCVFAGTRPLGVGPYYEDDEPDATDIYGESKAFGEVTGAPHLTVRCSFVGWGGGLLEWLADPHEVPISLWKNAYWSGSTAPAIASALCVLAQRPEVTGLMHLTRGVRYTKARLISELWDEGVLLEQPYVETSDPYLNRWLATRRADVPVLPPLTMALRELRELRR